MSGREERGPVAAGMSGSSAPRREEAGHSASDFVKKIYRMLEDPSNQPVVCWGPLGDCFVVKDMNEFSKSVLPKIFKHSNFASFVRQLNKYDFHKVKNSDPDNQFGEHSWTFRHPNFLENGFDGLENIKRKVAPRRSPMDNSATDSNNNASDRHQSSGNFGRIATHTSRGIYQVDTASNPSSNAYTSPSSQQNSSSSGASLASQASLAQIATLTAEVQRLKDESDELRHRVRGLERNYESVLREIAGFQKGMAQHGEIVHSLIGLALDKEKDDIMSE